MMSGYDLAARVRDELAYEPSLRESEASVRADAGTVVLEGRVDSYVERLVAERAAMRVHGVGSVVNLLEVSLPERYRRADPDIAAAARSILGWTVNVPADTVEVQVEHGIVQLSGLTDWQYQKEAAERAVQSLIGVRGVRNKIRVTPRSAASGLKDRVEAAIKRSSLCDIDRINVEARAGAVTLSGEVASWADRDEVERIAWAAPGVLHVDCHLKVAPCSRRRGVTALS